MDTWVYGVWRELEDRVRCGMRGGGGSAKYLPDVIPRVPHVKRASPTVTRAIDNVFPL